MFPNPMLVFKTVKIVYFQQQLMFLPVYFYIKIQYLLMYLYCIYVYCQLQQLNFLIKLFIRSSKILLLFVNYER